VNEFSNKTDRNAVPYYAVDGVTIETYLLVVVIMVLLHVVSALDAVFVRGTEPLETVEHDFAVDGEDWHLKVQPHHFSALGIFGNNDVSISAIRPPVGVIHGLDFNLGEQGFEGGLGFFQLLLGFRDRYTVFVE